MAQPEIIKDINDQVSAVDPNGDTMVGTLKIQKPTWPQLLLHETTVDRHAVNEIDTYGRYVISCRANTQLANGTYLFLDKETQSLNNIIRWGRNINGVWEEYNILHSGNFNNYTDSFFKRKVIANGTDFNTILTEGYYHTGYQHNCINTPNNATSMEFGLQVLNTRYRGTMDETDTGWTWQTAYPAYGDRVYHRYKDGANAWSSWRTILDSNNFSSYALPLTGGTLTGTLKMSTYRGIYTRHIDGSLDGFSGELYLNYNNNASIMLGHGGGYYISADGAFYSGTANKSRSLLAFMTSNEPNNITKYKLILTKKITAWSNHRATFATSSRHNGNGILSIAFGCNDNTVSDATVYGEIVYFGNSNNASAATGNVWHNDRFVLYYNNTNQEFYLFCVYYDYSPTTLTLLNSYTSGSGGQIVYDNLVDGVYVDSFNGYGIQICQSKRGWVEGDLITGAIWNDYAEYRKAESIEPGRVVIESEDGEMKLSTDRLQPGAEIISDTFGFAIGETDDYKTPIAAAGRVLAYPNEDRYSYPLGCAVCSGPNGTVSQMTREEIKEYPERIIGTVSEIPEYKTWGTGNVEVNGRIWIRIK